MMCPDYVIYMLNQTSRLDTDFSVLLEDSFHFGRDESFAKYFKEIRKQRPKKWGSSEDRPFFPDSLFSPLPTFLISFKIPAILYQAIHINSKYSLLRQLKGEYNDILKCAKRLPGSQSLENNTFNPKYG